DRGERRPRRPGLDGERLLSFAVGVEQRREVAPADTDQRAEALEDLAEGALGEPGAGQDADEHRALGLLVDRAIADARPVDIEDLEQLVALREHIAAPRDLVACERRAGHLRGVRRHRRGRVLAASSALSYALRLETDAITRRVIRRRC